MKNLCSLIPARALRTGGLALAMCLFAAQGAQATPQDDVQQIRSLNEQYVRAVVDRDHAWFEQRLLEDFVCVAGDGRQLDKRQFLAAEPVDFVRTGIEDVRVRLYGDTAIVNARFTYALANGRSGVTAYTDVYVRRDGQWRVASAQLTRES